MSDTQTPEIDANAAAFFADYLKRDADMGLVFDSSTRVVQEVLRRLEKSLFDGLQYKDDSPPKPEVIKAVKDLGKVINEMAAVKLRIDKEARTKAGRLTMNEKIDQVHKFILALPDAYRAELLTKFSE